MTTPNDDRQFADKARALFDESVDELDAATLSRLNRGRHQALEKLTRATPMRHWMRWAPAGGVAAAAVLAVMLLQNPGVEPLLDVPATATDLEILFDEHSIEMFEELEFFAVMEGLEENGNVG